MSEVPLYLLFVLLLFLGALDQVRAVHIRFGLKAQGPYRTCDESKEEEEEVSGFLLWTPGFGFRVSDPGGKGESLGLSRHISCECSSLIPNLMIDLGVHALGFRFARFDV